MLTDTALRKLKPKAAPYKVSDRDGMYVTVSKTGTVTFRYDYRLNGRRETLTLVRYGPGGISLALAERHGHVWFSHLSLDGVDLGRGKRSLVPGGRLHPRYQITLPGDLDEQLG